MTDPRSLVAVILYWNDGTFDRMENARFENGRGPLVSAVDRILRIAGYACVVLIGILSLLPGTLRPDTGAPGKLEHLIAYLGAATLLALGRSVPHQRWQALWLIPCAGALELAQLYIPERHARFSDFVVSSIGAALGLAIAFAIAPLLSQLLASLNLGGKRA
jgi:VanZ family protein